MFGLLLDTIVVVTTVAKTVASTVEKIVEDK